METISIKENPILKTQFSFLQISWSDAIGVFYRNMGCWEGFCPMKRQA
jgi:hypothetical protein